MLQNIHWLGHDSFLIKRGKTIYIDPFKLKETKDKADLILITHDHFDHFSLEDINKIRKNSTIVVGPEELKGKIDGNLKLLKPFQSIIIDNIKIEAVPSYNVNKFKAPGKVFHPKEDNKLGFIITIDNKKIYHAGDTDLIQEMSRLKNIEIALLPISGTYVMTPEEAAQAVDIIKPRIAIPMHWGKILATIKDAERFKRLVGNRCQVEILKEK